MDCNQIIIDTATTGSKILQANGGNMPAGHNGPWNDSETPLRNTSHWLITFISAHKLTKDQKFKQAAQTCLDYILDPERRPSGHTFLHRNNKYKDSCNGLIGQAWTVEALAIAADHLNSDAAATLAIDVVLTHPFDEDIGLWRSIDIDGTDLGIHGTFNQQLYFAAAASLLQNHDNSIKRNVEKFINNIKNNIHIRSSGLIVHHGYLAPLKEEHTEPGKVIIRVRNYIEKILGTYSKSNRILEFGYHSFNLYALGILKEQFPEYDLWNSILIEKLSDILETPKYKNSVSNNIYSFEYNPTGIEIAYFLEKFDRSSKIGFWLNEQFRRCYDNNNKLLHSAWDGTTLSARIYELTRLSNYDIQIQ